MSLAAETAAADEIRDRASRRAIYQQDWAWARFTQWCQGYNLEASLPMDEHVMLLFLHDHYPNWSWSHARNVSTYLRALHARHGLDDPAGERTSTYLARLRKDVGSRKAQPTDPIRIDDASTIAQALDEPSSVWARRELHASQAILLVARATDLGIVGYMQPGHLTSASFKVTPQCVTVTPPIGNETVIVADRDRNPEHYDIMVNALNTPDLRPLGRDDVAMMQRKARIVSAWNRAGNEGRAPVVTVSDLDAETFNKWVRAVDAHLERRLETTAFVLLGVLLARRAIDLCRLDHEHIKPVKGGYRLEFPITKTDPDGQSGGLVKFIPHALDESGTCKTRCPACALARHLDTQQERGRASGPVFRGYGGRGGGRLTVGGAYQRLRAAWATAELDQSAHIGSRSLRVGGATSASEAGWSLTQIATELTDHRSLDNAAVYVRRNNPLIDQATLDL